jgi:HEAT repeat protein
MVRHAAARAVSQIKGGASVDAMILALTDPDGEVRVIAASALGRSGERRAVAPLLKCLRDPETRVRVFALASLKSLGWKRLNPGADAEATGSLCPIDSPALLAGLAEKDDHVRLASAQALSTMGDPNHTGWFLPLLADPGFELRVAAANYFGRIHDPHFAVTLLPLLQDEDDDVRRAAALALGLVGALVDEEPAVRQAAEAALHMINPSWEKLDSVLKSSNRLKPLLNDPRPWVSAAAAQALTKINTARKNG